MVHEKLSEIEKILDNVYSMLYGVDIMTHVSDVGIHEFEHDKVIVEETIKHIKRRLKEQ